MWLGSFPLDLETTRLSELGRTIWPQHCLTMHWSPWPPLQQGSAAFLCSHELGSAEFWGQWEQLTSGNEECLPFAISKTKHLGIVRRFLYVFTNVPFLVQNNRISAQNPLWMEKKPKTTGSLWVTPLSFLRCNPFSNNSFLKYSPSVYRFGEEIKVLQMAALHTVPFLHPTWMLCFSWNCLQSCSNSMENLF